ncbi:MAG: GNAT family N-acetyltransferase [Deltaproteobacteria bacterium]|nr:GNAT family N-acetyltransferase [Deltaproteobacteria bacterium]
MIRYEFIDIPTPEQSRQIIHLYQAEGWWSIDENSNHILNKMIEGSHCFITAIDGDRIIGMGRAISDKSSDAYIQDVTVAEAYRKRGIGSEIIKKIISRLQADGLSWIGLIAEKNSHEFYRQLGFHQMLDAIPLLKENR